MSKVTVVGAGAVGATCANVMACREVASEVVLIDIKEGLSEGKMLDMYQCSTLMDFDTKVVGATNDYKTTANSDVVVITSGIPRKPGMTREELIGTNAGIMKGVIENVIKYSPRAIIIVVANPMDTLTYLALKASGLPKNRIIGMGGALDSARFKCYLAKATGANINNVDGMVIGGHGDTTMIPLVSKATVNGVPVSQFASKKKLEEAVANTMVGGATLTKLIGTSAWYAPGAGAAMMVEAILNDQKKMVPCCCYLDGEYGQKDICIGVPAIIGRKGIEKIVKIDLTKEEAEKIAEEKGFIFVEDAGRGYRRVVPSPIPKRIVELNVVDQLVRAGDIVITVGGGGIPVVETEDGLRGVAAVIDKDRASSLLAQDVRADRLIILTAVDAVCVNYNKPDQKELSSMTIAECEKYIAEGQFAPGSMLPKVESCMEFVKNNDHGGTALITSLARAADALEGKTGTVITR